MAVRDSHEENKSLVIVLGYCHSRVFHYSLLHLILKCKPIIKELKSKEIVLHLISKGGGCGRVVLTRSIATTQFYHRDSSHPDVHRAFFRTDVDRSSLPTPSRGYFGSYLVSPTYRVLSLGPH